LALIFRVEEQAKQETGTKVGGKQSSGIFFNLEDGGDMFLRNAG
jgi:hypothetical protein